MHKKIPIIKSSALQQGNQNQQYSKELKSNSGSSYCQLLCIMG